MAQTPPPDAGALRQQLERELDAPLPDTAEPLAPQEAPRIPLSGDVSLTVETFRFAGNTLLDEATLAAVVRPWLGRPVGFADLQLATQAVAQAFRDAGWIVSAHLPEQDVTDGVVTIEVLESRFAGATLEGSEPRRLRSALALGHVDAAQGRGEPLSASALDRALLLIDDLPGVSVGGALAPGERDGETALLLRLTDEPVAAGSAAADNAGARSTGAARVLFTGGLESPLRAGDRLRGDLLHSEGSDYVRLDYSLPVGRQGWRVGLNASHFEYELVTAEFAALDAQGDSGSLGLSASYPLLRSRKANLYFSFAGDERRFRNSANGQRQSDYAIGAVTVGLAGNRYDGCGGGGASSVQLSWSLGRVRHGAAQPGENAELAGGFARLRYALSREQRLTRTLSLLGSLSGQYANEALDSAERFYLGGPQGVRAYPVNDGGGNRSELVSTELRWRLQPTLQLTSFYDWGRVNDRAPAARYTLRSAGARAAWMGPLGLKLEATYAARLGRNPNPGIATEYQDGSRHRNRWWLTASLAF
ncbi:MAG: ShlB/FhaC/HecB family hemolysin secretion/activation protein [Acidobacteria bacterium]|nr:ShlB/FhaC/HecB family hemolysin secretion/activation protein [Acidobacteriota bacterium]